MLRIDTQNGNVDSFGPEIDGNEDKYHGDGSFGADGCLYIMHHASERKLGGSIPCMARVLSTARPIHDRMCNCV